MCEVLSRLVRAKALRLLWNRPDTWSCSQALIKAWSNFGGKDKYHKAIMRNTFRASQWSCVYCTRWSPRISRKVSLPKEREREREREFMEGAEESASGCEQMPLAANRQKRSWSTRSVSDEHITGWHTSNKSISIDYTPIHRVHWPMPQLRLNNKTLVCQTIRVKAVRAFS